MTVAGYCMYVPPLHEPGERLPAFARKGVRKTPCSHLHQCTLRNDPVAE